MKTLIIYDQEGIIIQQIAGNYRIPVGIPYLEVDVPEDKYAVSVNPTTKEVTLTDVPKGEVAILKNRLEEQELAILELANMIGGTV